MHARFASKHHNVFLFVFSCFSRFRNLPASRIDECHWIAVQKQRDAHADTGREGEKGALAVS